MYELVDERTGERLTATMFESREDAWRRVAYWMGHPSATVERLLYATPREVVA